MSLRIRKTLLLEAALVTFVAGLLLSYSVPRFLASQNVNAPDHFPDPGFRRAVEEFMQVEPGERFSFSQLAERKGALNLTGFTVKNVEGMKYLQGITALKCSGLSLQQLDLSRNRNLRILICAGNKLQELDLRHLPDLQNLDCSNNQLTKLDLSANIRLQSLDCSANQLTELNLTQNPDMRYVKCNDNMLTELPLISNAHVRYVNCSDNQIAALDVSSASALETLDASNNQIGEISFAENHRINWVDLLNNELTEVPVFPEEGKMECVDIRLNLLDHDCCSALMNLKPRLPSFMVRVMRHKVGLLYFPQKGSDPLNCLEEEQKVQEGL
ncbi:MAG: leucine-rich repeat domain-containing protein [bacterium]